MNNTSVDSDALMFAKKRVNIITAVELATTRAPLITNTENLPMHMNASSA